mgnify:CR=1 FL=1
MLDIRVQPREGLSVDDLLAAMKELSRYYPQITRYEPVEDERNAAVSEARTLDSASRISGLLFSAKDNRRYIQAALDGLTLNVLAPYNGWEALRAEAEVIYQYYTMGCEPKIVTAISLRYINNVVGNEPLFQFDRYLTVHPVIAKGFLGAEVIAGFYMQLQLPQRDDPKTTLVLTEASRPSPLGSVTIMLDLEVRKQREWSPADRHVLFAEIDLLHTRAYNAFLNCTTTEYRKSIS